LLGYAKDFLKGQSFQEPEVVVQHNLVHVVGMFDVVETTGADTVLYAKRLNREAYTRFVKNRLPIPTRSVTMVLRKRDDGSYELWSIWIGPWVPPFPGDDVQSPGSKIYWSHHALVWGNQAIQEGTETSEQPW
jgi:hypothetical protein